MGWSPHGSKVYISYNRQDAELARSIAGRLQELGHDVAIDIGLIPGTDWRATLNDALKQSQAFIALLTENALASQFVASEIGAARAYSQASGNMLVIPVIADKIPVPHFISDLYAIIVPDRDVNRIVAAVDGAIAKFTSEKAAEEQRREEQNAQVEANAAVYVDDAMTSLRKNEERDRRLASWWYALGITALVAGIAFGFWSLRDVVASSQVTGNAAASAHSLTVEWLLFARALLKAAVIVGLLVTITKYCFVLGKAYMSEALKSADRIHAISYGRFYLRAFGAHADPQQLKEVFQHWNIDHLSAFGAATTEQFDPKFAETVVEVAKLLTKVTNKEAAKS